MSAWSSVLYPWAGPLPVSMALGWGNRNMKAQHGAGALALMHAIKQALDPKNESGKNAAAIVIELSISLD